MNGEERYSVILFSFMPSYLRTETMLRDSGNEYFTKEVSATALEELKHMSLCSDALFKIVMEKSQKAASYLEGCKLPRKHDNGKEGGDSSRPYPARDKEPRALRDNGRAGRGE